jgi:hypothetical protein
MTLSAAHAFEQRERDRLGEYRHLDLEASSARMSLNTKAMT